MGGLLEDKLGENLRLEPEDVTVEAIADECGDCTETIEGQGFTVMVDFRSAGIQESLGRFCKSCAEQLAQRIRDGQEGK